MSNRVQLSSTIEPGADSASSGSAVELIGLDELVCVEDDQGSETALVHDTERPGRPAQSAMAAPGLQLPAEYLAEAQRLRARFQAAEVNAAPAERLLEDLIAGEVPIAMALADAEGALVALLQGAITDPKLAVEVARVFKETTALASAVRRRIEHSAGAIANLRAQRLFLEGHRGKRGL